MCIMVFEIDSKTQNSQDKSLILLAPPPNTFRRSGIRDGSLGWKEKETL